MQTRYNRKVSELFDMPWEWRRRWLSQSFPARYVRSIGGLTTKSLFLKADHVFI